MSTPTIDQLFERFGRTPTPVFAVESGDGPPLARASQQATVTSLHRLFSQPDGPRGLLSREELPVVVTVAPNAHACALCRGALGTKRVECASCRAFVHPGCAKASGGCPSIGCAQRRARRARRPAPVRPAKAAAKAKTKPTRELRELALAPALPRSGPPEQPGSTLADRLSLVGFFASMVTLLACTACVAVFAVVRLANLLGTA